MANSHTALSQSLVDPFYYLANFQQVLDWVGACHDDLLDETELAFLERFPQLPKLSRALLVRMAMRKGSLFRADKLLYGEIGCPLQAAGPLIELGWVNDAPLLGLETLFDLLTKDEVVRAFNAPASLTKAALLDRLRPGCREARRLVEWCPQLDEQVLQLRVDELCERLRDVLWQPLAGLA